MTTLKRAPFLRTAGGVFLPGCGGRQRQFEMTHFLIENAITPDQANAIASHER
jgi:hypothetical protein